MTGEPAASDKNHAHQLSPSTGENPLSKNTRCVYVANTQAEAIGITLWLESQGIESLLIDKTTLGISYGVSFSSADPNADGWQVWVKEESQIELAQQALADRKQKKQARAEMGPIDASCENCGQTSQFSGECRGTIQDCPFCKKYVDVGGLDEEFEWPDESE